MRMMLTVQMPTAAANEAIHDGRFAKLLASTMERIKPEAVYFTSIDGDRAGYFIFDMQHPSDIPWVAESFFNETHAKVTFAPVMTPEDVQAGFAKLAQAQ